jgi:hypothetical protein
MADERPPGMLAGGHVPEDDLSGAVADGDEFRVRREPNREGQAGLASAALAALLARSQMLATPFRLTVASSFPSALKSDVLNASAGRK